MATYNIRNGRGGGLISALRAMERSNVDLAVLTETKLTDGIYTRESLGYRVMATNATSRHQGGVALVCRQATGWQVESEQCFGPNTVGFVLTTGRRRYSCVGTYIPPADTTTVNFIGAAFAALPNNPRILLGDLNVNLSTLQMDERTASIAELVTNLGLEDGDTLSFFKQRRQHRGKTTWSMYRRDVGMVRSRCDYILTDDRQAFVNSQIMRPRHYNSEHMMILAVMGGEATSSNKQYLQTR